jgi:choline kinase
VNELLTGDSVFVNSSDPSSAPASDPVHVVVLAAGRGSRLSQGAERPKWLLEVAGRGLAERHLEGIAGAAEAGAVTSTAVVVGHEGDAIEAFAADRGDLTIVRNPEFAELNNWWSLLRALRELPHRSPVAVINADLLVDPEHVRDFLLDAAASREEATICVDLERDLTDESMKVSRRADGSLERIGKVDVEDPAGEYIGMLMARGGALAALRAELERFVGRPESADEWYEGAVGRTAAAGVEWRIWPLPGGNWIEIDDDDDLARAEAMAAVA